MSVSTPDCPYLLIIDTDKYSGNFERELTGFCTGVDDGTHGEKEGQDFFDWLDDVGKVSGWGELVTTCNEEDNGFPRVCTIWPTPGRLNNGSGFHYDDGGDEDEARAKAKQSMIEYHAPHIKQCQDRLDNNDFEEDRPGAWTKEACERTIAGHLSSIERAGIFVRWPAYESVAIFLSAKPSETDMAIFMERLKDFSENMMCFGKRTDTKLQIKGVRLVKRETKIIETVIEEYRY